MTEPITTAHAGAKLASCTVQITQELIDVYASISGDFNPIHVDTEAARASEFGGTIAHGCIPLEPVFQAIGRWCGADVLPPDAVIRLRYRAPARPGDVIRSECLIAGVQQVQGRRRVQIDFVCVNQRDEKVLDGTCVLTP